MQQLSSSSRAAVNKTIRITPQQIDINEIFVLLPIGKANTNRLRHAGRADLAAGRLQSRGGVAGTSRRARPVSQHIRPNDG
ncbi:MAG: hypothetical protein KJ787_07280 [Gammaproteobacteria bacterium]|nr:hypothetical protein [Gammaproteobacteria bacterium]MBU1646121.1 hypothetical protein [Gammaproteobacteria bacterium]MBU1972183.1 hypothetical protein [Gammaproteobacteria bacterium]